LRWFFDHAETIFRAEHRTVKVLGGGIAVQDRMAFQGEYFIDRYGKKAAEHSPPIRRMLAMGVPVGAGTDATRVGATTRSCRCTGWSPARRSGRHAAVPRDEPAGPHGSPQALHRGQRVFSGEEDKKGSVEVGKLADVACCPRTTSRSRGGDQGHRVGAHRRRGKVVYGAGEFEGWPRRPCRSAPAGHRSGRTAATTQRNPPSPTIVRTPACFTNFSMPSPTRHAGWRAPWPVGLPCECFAF